MPVTGMNARSLISPVGITRFFEIFLSCTAFSLVANAKAFSGPYGTWCMFSWCFCFAVTVLIIVLELTELFPRLPLSWDDFTSAFSMLAALMIFTSSIVYPSVYIHGTCSTSVCARQAAATAMSCLCFIAYAIEVGLTRARPGDVSSFLSTVPGLLKVFEAYVACLIFSLVDNGHSYYHLPGLQWSMAVYCICFILTLLIIILTIGQCLAYIPFPLEKVLVGYNALAVLMYLTTAVIWPYYSFKGVSRPSPCNSDCQWNSKLGVTFLTYFNLIAYIVDLVYSSKMVFFVTATT
ncbi:myeloid-associated differentiation marker homolog [Alligator mississippiensis]|uniref:Myeloid-associated differentiation marker-like protein n=1 Tax=Alligator mississippiensis TaxID=8496 RepID=A0A151N6R7_ALLMI|nr:myeloid-associated differentiation marker homolog [Alligator mississippiensis]KYO32496.1 myeloid-associated differentiation marker-like protein [Alligator mississippiensis]